MGSCKLAALAGVAVLICGCEAKLGSADGNSEANVQRSAEGKAEEGMVALDAPGLNFKIRIPLDRAQTDSQSELLYPGSTITGIYIAAQPDSKTGSDGEVELRFASPDAPEKIAAWYRDRNRQKALTLSSDTRDGAAYLLAGTGKGNEEGFRLRLEPKAAGTGGRLTVRDKP
jgi:hypothetical protein